MTRFIFVFVCLICEKNYSELTTNLQFFRALFRVQKYRYFGLKVVPRTCDQKVTWLYHVTSVDLTQNKTWWKTRGRQWKKEVYSAEQPKLYEFLYNGHFDARLPSDPTLRAKWVKFVQRHRADFGEPVIKCASLCSAHLKQSCLKTPGIYAGGYGRFQNETEPLHC